jgi:hypothetical protein
MIPSLLFVLCIIQYQKLQKKDSQKEWKNVSQIRKKPTWFCEKTVLIFRQ